MSQSLDGPPTPALSPLSEHRKEEPMSQSLDGLPTPPLSPLSDCSEVTGFRSPDALSEATVVASPIEDRPVECHASLIEDRPIECSELDMVGVTDDSLCADATSFVGHNRRSERMHSFLLQEFANSGAGELSFQELCTLHAQGRRDTMAGCFFELLVLKTNGTIDLDQEHPDADIKITMPITHDSALSIDRELHT
mmetsp:Transcript_9907/g.18391  ORF Transcript_9907/g.18391 Transcript_9907/m.18391 type:complete len:195 (-) Transcript_9907:119-703(-)